MVHPSAVPSLFIHVLVGLTVATAGLDLGPTKQCYTVSLLTLDASEIPSMTSRFGRIKGGDEVIVI